MVKNLLYIVGIPGAGKTALLTAALKDVPYEVERTFFQKRIYPGGVMLGGDRLVQRLNLPQEALFSGTDALQRHSQPKVIKWLENAPFNAIVGEGDRPSNRSFFEGAMEAGWNVQLVFLNCDTNLAIKRQQQRGYVVNGMRFRIACTKVLNLMGMGYKDVLDAREPLHILVEQFRTFKVIRQIRGE